jgi:hypothetical protein
MPSFRKFAAHVLEFGLIERCYGLMGDGQFESFRGIRPRHDLHFPLALPKLRIEHLLLTGDPPETEEIPA